MDFIWEKVDDVTDNNYHRQVTYRVKVTGGWLIKTVDFMFTSESGSVASSMVFLPDGNAQWQVPKM